MLFWGFGFKDGFKLVSLCCGRVGGSGYWVLVVGMS